MPKGYPRVITDMQWFCQNLDSGLTDANCWTWRGKYIHNGYGQMWQKRIRKSVYAHRYAYEQFVGPIPDGLQLDHLCRNRGCVNPAHLEPATNRVNVLRGMGPTALNARKTHCKRGHPLVPENLYILAGPSRGGYVSRECKTCNNLRRRKGYRG